MALDFGWNPNTFASFIVTSCCQQNLRLTQFGGRRSSNRHEMPQSPTEIALKGDNSILESILESIRNLVALVLVENFFARRWSVGCCCWRFKLKASLYWPHFERRASEPRWPKGKHKETEFLKENLQRNTGYLQMESIDWYTNGRGCFRWMLKSLGERC